MWWVICHSIVVLFELFGIFMILLWIADAVLIGKKPRWINTLVKLFLIDFEDYGDD